MATTIKLQDVVTQMRAYPQVVPVLGTGALTQEPALTIANDVVQRILSAPFDWKWNRAYVPSILTVALEQDYPTQITDIGWLESGWRIDINNSTNNGNLAPKPIFTMESVRDLDQTSYQANPFQLSFIPNSLAFLGQWQPNTEILCGYGVAQVPIQPIQAFKDQNGNLLYIDSTVLGLNINSPGFAGTPVVLPIPNPYGTTGNTKPFAVPNAPAGTQVIDGTVTWTVADPNGYAIRVAPLPAFSGLAWLIVPVYQKKPVKFTSLQNLITPIPDEYAYLFRRGFLAMCKEHSGAKDARDAYAKWEEDLQVAVASADREREENVMFPSEGLTGGPRLGIPLGPANPFNYGGYF